MLWDLFQDLRDLQGEIDRLFVQPSIYPGLYYTTNRSKNPPMNLREDLDNLYLDVIIPGVEKDNIHININDHILTLSGQKPLPANATPKDYHRRERMSGNFLRAVELPMDIDVNKVVADYENGILTIKLPKAESAKPKIIEVKVK